MNLLKAYGGNRSGKQVTATDLFDGPPPQVRELAAAQPVGELHVVNAGQTPVYETPGEVAAAVLDLRVRAGRTFPCPS